MQTQGVQMLIACGKNYHELTLTAAVGNALAMDRISFMAQSTIPRDRSMAGLVQAYAKVGSAPPSLNGAAKNSDHKRILLSKWRIDARNSPQLTAA
jgi:hypothetical protein